MRVLDPTARARFHAAGAKVTDLMVRLDPALVETHLKTVPPTFTLAARNPARALRIGGTDMVFASVGGPAYVMDTARGRREGTLAEMEDYLRLIQVLNVIQQEGGGPFEPMDLPPTPAIWTSIPPRSGFWTRTGRPRPLAAPARWTVWKWPPSAWAKALRRWRKPPPYWVSSTPIRPCNWTSHGRRADDAGRTRAGQRHHPFTLAGAMAPVSLAGALTLQHAEALAGITLTQIVNPGVPVMYGGFTSNVDMASGAPAFGTPEYAKAAMASGQLARHIGVPFRSSNVTSANAVDAQAAYESQMAIWGAILGGVHLLEHAAGWMHGGLTASFEKLILDAEMLQMMQATLDPIATDPAELALEAIAQVGPGGHFFGSPHTLDRYREAFHRPLISDWSPHEAWLAAGSLRSEAHAAALIPRLLAEYHEPTLPPDRAEALAAYVARRKAEGGAPMN